MSAAFRLACVMLPTATLALLSGCMQLDLKKPFAWPLASDDKPGTADRLTAVWTDVVRHKTDSPPVRGFGGRLMFYGAEDDKPIKVDGSLVVYAFDETSRDPANNKPDRKYVFPAANLDLHYSKSKLGHSYSVFVPWDNLGGVQKEISLIVRFLPKQGTPVISKMTKHLLPGTPPQLVAAPQPAQNTPAAQGPVRPVSHEVPIPAQQPQATSEDGLAKHMSTTTITIPPRFGRPRPVASIPARPARPTVTVQRGSANPAPRGKLNGVHPLGQQPTPAAQATPAQSGPLPRQARSSLGRSPAEGEPTARPTHDRTSWPPCPATSPADPQSAPPPAKASGYWGRSTAAEPAYY